MKKIIGYFMKGLLVFIPVSLTILIIALTFTKLDGLLKDLLGIDTPGLGLVITLAFITILGFFASNFVGRWLFRLIDALFNRLPLVKLLYSSLKDFIEAFAGEKKSFDKPVLVELTKDGPSAIGFITKDDLDFLSVPDQVAVYFPQSYNFAGSVLIFPKQQVKLLDVESSTAMTFIVSGGVAGPSKTNS